MKTIIYHPDSGNIKSIGTSSLTEPKDTDAWIQIDHDIKINEWKVNVASKQLVRLTHPKPIITLHELRQSLIK
jgi:hypothetical protein